MTQIPHNVLHEGWPQKLADWVLENGKKRFLLPLSLVTGLKLLVAYGVYALAIQGGEAFATFWMGEWGAKPQPDWPFLFHGWDSAWYIRIAKTGYSYPAYAFFPAYPLLIRAGSALTGEYWASSLIVSFSLGTLAVPMFQVLAEHYVGRREAAVSTLLFGLFPPTFFFTSIAYTESLFAVTILGTWILCLRKRYLSSTVLAAIAAVTKVYGVLIALPLAMSTFDQHDRKNVLLALLVPSATILAWSSYLFNLTGDWMAYWSSQDYWKKGWPFGINSTVRFIVESTGTRERGVVGLEKMCVIIILLFIVVLFGVLVVASLDVDKDFGTYATLLFLFLTTFGNVWSFFRFFPFIMPVWITLKTKSVLVPIAAILVFPVISLVIWYRFVVLGIWLG